MELDQDVPMGCTLAVDIKENDPGAARLAISNELIASQICVQALQQSELEIRGQKLLLTSLARTCQDLYVPALKEIWRSLDGLAPLVKLMPGDCWEIVEVKVQSLHKKFIRFTRPITRLDCDRFWFHAKFVRNHHAYFQPGIQEDSSIYTALDAIMKDRGEAAILPNLETLEWTDISSCFPFTAFLNPFLKSIKLSLGDSQPVQNLATICPNLRVITLYTYDNDASFAAISSTFTSLQCLTSLRTNTLTTEAYIKFAEHPTLEELYLDHISTIDWAVVESQRLDARPFLRLRKIRLVSHDMDTIRSMLQTMNHSPLHEIKLTFSTKQSGPTWGGVTQLIQAAETYNELSSIGFSDFDYIDIRSVVEDPLLPEHLEPLFSFRHLVHVDLHLHCYIALDDDCIRKLAESWPQLKDLRIQCQQTEIAASRSPKVTFDSLMHFAINCPSLESLTLAFDAQNPQLPEYTLGNSVSSKLTRLLVALSSPINNPEMVAAIFSDWFPQLKYLDWEERDPDFPTQSDWERVRDLMPDLKKIRLQEWRRAGRE